MSTGRPPIVLHISPATWATIPSTVRSQLESEDTIPAPRIPVNSPGENPRPEAPPVPEVAPPGGTIPASRPAAAHSSAPAILGSLHTAVREQEDRTRLARGSLDEAIERLHRIDRSLADARERIGAARRKYDEACRDFDATSRQRREAEADIQRRQQHLDVTRELLRGHRQRLAQWLVDLTIDSLGMPSSLGAVASPAPPATPAGSPLPPPPPLYQESAAPPSLRAPTFPQQRTPSDLTPAPSGVTTGHAASAATSTSPAERAPPVQEGKANLFEPYVQAPQDSAFIDAKISDLSSLPPERYTRAPDRQLIQLSSRMLKRALMSEAIDAAEVSLRDVFAKAAAKGITNTAYEAARDFLDALRYVGLTAGTPGTSQSTLRQSEGSSQETHIAAGREAGGKGQAVGTESSETKSSVELPPRDAAEAGAEVEDRDGTSDPAPSQPVKCQWPRAQCITLAPTPAATADPSAPALPH